MRAAVTPDLPVPHQPEIGAAPHANAASLTAPHQMPQREPASAGRRARVARSVPAAASGQPIPDPNAPAPIGRAAAGGGTTPPLDASRPPHRAFLPVSSCSCGDAFVVAQLGQRACTACIQDAARAPLTARRGSAPRITRTCS
jgi:hypothetical protein